MRKFAAISPNEIFNSALNNLIGLKITKLITSRKPWIQVQDINQASRQTPNGEIPATQSQFQDLKRAFRPKPVCWACQALVSLAVPACMIFTCYSNCQIIQARHPPSLLREDLLAPEPTTSSQTADTKDVLLREFQSFLEDFRKVPNSKDELGPSLLDRSFWPDLGYAFTALDGTKECCSGTKPYLYGTLFPHHLSTSICAVTKGRIQRRYEDPWVTVIRVRQ